MVAGLESVREAAVPELKPVPAPRLVRAAHEFEAQMMKELLTPMTEKDPLFRDSDQKDAGILGQFAAERLAGALSGGRGLGIADRIVHELSPFDHPATGPQAVEKFQKNTGMSPSK